MEMKRMENEKKLTEVLKKNRNLRKDREDKG